MTRATVRMTLGGVISLACSPHSCTSTRLADDRKEIDWHFDQLLGYQGVVGHRDRPAVKMGSLWSFFIHKSRRNFEYEYKRTNLSITSSVDLTRVNTLGYYKIATGDMSNSLVRSLFWKAKCACSRMTLWRLVVSRVLNIYIGIITNFILKILWETRGEYQFVAYI